MTRLFETASVHQLTHRRGRIYFAARPPAAPALSRGASLEESFRGASLEERLQRSVSRGASPEEPLWRSLSRGDSLQRNLSRRASPEELL